MLRERSRLIPPSLDICDRTTQNLNLIRHAALTLPLQVLPVTAQAALQAPSIPARSAQFALRDMPTDLAAVLSVGVQFPQSWPFLVDLNESSSDPLHQLGETYSPRLS